MRGTGKEWVFPTTALALEETINLARPHLKSNETALISIHEVGYWSATD